MNLGKAESRSISLPLGLWDLVDKAGGQGARTRWIREAIETRLKAEGHMLERDEFDLLEILRAAKEEGVPVAEVISEYIERRNLEEGTAA